MIETLLKLIPKTKRNQWKERLIKIALRDHLISCKYELSYTQKLRADRKVILVTGATGAIGSAICYRMAMEGAIVGICGRSHEKISVITDKILESKPDALLEPILLDVQNEDQIKDAINTLVSKYGRLDVLVNNAGGGSRKLAKPLSEQDTQIIDSILNTNLRGSILCAKYASNQMKLQQSGKIISMSSVMGMNGQANWTEYSSSKSGIVGMTKSLALELGPYGITVNSVSPGSVQQRIFDHGYPEVKIKKNALKRFGYTDEVANLLAFLISDEANFITGQNIAVDGGRSIGLPQ